MTPAPLQSSEWPELYESEGQWYMYIPGPIDGLGQHYDSSNTRLEPEVAQAILKKFEEALVEATRIITAIVEQEGGEYVVHKSALVSLPRNIVLERSDNEPSKDGIVYRTKRLDSLRKKGVEGD